MSDTKATYKSIRKALSTLNDPFTRFLEPAQFAALRRGTAGAVTGVGLEIGFESRNIDSRVVVRLCYLANATDVVTCVHAFTGEGRASRICKSRHSHLKEAALVIYC